MSEFDDDLVTVVSGSIFIEGVFCFSKRRRVYNNNCPKSKLIELLEEAITNTKDEIAQIIKEIEGLESNKKVFKNNDDDCQNISPNQDEHVKLDFIEMYDNFDDMSSITYFENDLSFDASPPIKEGDD